MLPSAPLWPGGGGVCPKPRLKGRRGCISTAYQLPVTRADENALVIREDNMKPKFKILIVLLVAVGSAAVLLHGIFKNAEPDPYYSAEYFAGLLMKGMAQNLPENLDLCVSSLKAAHIEFAERGAHFQAEAVDKSNRLVNAQPRAKPAQYRGY